MCLISISFKRQLNFISFSSDAYEDERVDRCRGARKTLLTSCKVKVTFSRTRVRCCKVFYRWMFLQLCAFSAVT